MALQPRFESVKSIAFNVLMGLFVAALFLLAIDFGIRLFLPFPLTSTTTYQAFPDVTYFHKPDSLGYEISPLGEFKPVWLKYDGEGFREHDLARSWGASSEAIVLLGDSFVEGRQVESNETMTGLLQARFPQQRVINAGCSGYTTTTEFLLLKNRLLNLAQKPKKIFLFFSFNDYADNYWYYSGYYNQKNIFSTGVPDKKYVPTVYEDHFKQFENMALANSSIYAYAKQAFKPPYQIRQWKEVVESKRFNDSPRNVNKATADLDDLELEILNFTHQGILEMNTLAKKMGVELTVVIIPLPPQVNKGEWKKGKEIFGYAPEETIESRIYQDRLMAFLDQHAIKNFDLLPVFLQTEGVEKRPVFLDFDGHFSAAGHRAIADFLAPQIESRR